MSKATSSTVGVVKPGTGLSVDAAGTLSVNIGATELGKALTGDGIIGVTNGGQSVLVATGLQINAGTITTTQIQDNTIGAKDLDWQVPGAGLVYKVDNGTKVAIDVQAENGIKVANDFVKLGGPLTEPTVITTTASNTLAVQGLQKGADADKIVVNDANGVLKQIKAAMPKFFYMPSIVMLTAQDQIVPGDGFSYSGGTNGTFTVDLHARYAAQFGSPLASNTTKTTTLPVLANGELDYYITWFDNTVFTNVAISNTGVLTYKINQSSGVSIGSFMNIVFAVKP